MKVYKCGTKATITAAKIDAQITGVTIRYNAVAYELSYFWNGERKEVWINETEFVITDGSKKVNIGFK